jgi:uncharacterized membrane protein
MIEISTIVLQLLIFFVLPAYLIRLSRKVKADTVLSDIVICYGIGMVLGNTKQWWLYSWTGMNGAEGVASLTTQIAQVSAYGAVLLAIPLLLMVNNVTDWLKYTGKITIVFFLGVFSTLVVSITLGYIFRDRLHDVATVSGMMTGVYIGGTPNMVAISKALNADDSLFIILNATDTICSGLYFFLLIGVGKALIGLVLPVFQSTRNQQTLLDESREAHDHPFPPEQRTWSTITPLLLATGIALGAIALSVIPAVLIKDVKGQPNQTVLMLTLTTVGIALSFSKKVRTLQGVYPYAQYLLLIFGLAAGFMTDFTNLLETGTEYLGFNVVFILSMIVLHLILTRLVKGDTESFMITSTACILGPPFVAQVASSLKNKELLPVGIALSLLGLGIANYAGVFVAWLVGQF